MIRTLFNTLFLLAVWALVPHTGFAQCLNWLTPSGNPIVTADLTSNDPELWNDAAFSDPWLGGSDLAEGTHPTLLFKANCGPNPTFSFVLRLDLDRDGVKETVLTPDNQLPGGALWINNANEPGYIGTEQAFFDQRPVNSADKYHFVLHTATQNDTTLVRLAWESTALPGGVVDAQIPYGIHELELTATNGSETQTQSYTLEVKDTQSPDMACINGLSVNLMATGVVQIWASDMLQFVQDNYSLWNNIDLGIRRAGAGTGFPLNPDGSVKDFEIFDCADSNDSIYIELWARDEYGNTQVCASFVRVLDDFFICDPELAMQYQPAQNCEDDNYIWAVVTGGKPPIVYQWSNGAASPYLLNVPNGTYAVTITDDFGRTLTDEIAISDVPAGCGVIKGTLYKDANNNCAYNGSELVLQNQTIQLEDANGNLFLTTTDANGYFQKRLAPGNYEVSAIVNNNLWAACSAPIAVALTSEDTVSVNLGLLAQYDCAAMTVEVQVPFLLSCSINEYWVQYCNEGTDTATDAYVDIDLDGYLTLLSATVPYTLLSGNTYRFTLGNAAITACGSFAFSAFLDCESVSGQTHCVSAAAAPTGDCLPQNAQWSGASIDLIAHCDSDSLRFEIKNVGQADMTESVEYIVIEDLVMVHQGNVGPLAAGQSMPVALPYNGAAWRMEVEQVAFHPGASKPAVSVEACNGNVFTLGTVNQFYQDEGNPWEDTECMENTNAYFTNIKYASPGGYGPNHAIEPGTLLNYNINFLNLTPDTVHTVIIRDTLSEWLDPATLSLSGTYWPYQFEFEGNGPNLKFTFDNVNLPPIDFNNPYNSFHWVSFSVLPKTDVPLGTDIYNTGHIYFDSDPAIVTNTVQHRIQQGFVAAAISSAPETPRAPSTPWLEVSPNPTSDWLLLKHPVLPAGKKHRLVLLDMNGKTLLTVPCTSGTAQKLPLGTWVAGTYTAQLWADNQCLSSVPFVKK